jgi:hypothetical protein
MDPTASIRRLGFRKWYERELIKCHAALVTCCLAGLLLAALMETMSRLSWSWRSAGELGIAFAAIVVAWGSWRSYITILGRAELYGERSSCPGCQAYGLFTVLATGLDEAPSAAAIAVQPLSTAWLRVQCRKCGAAWRMPHD